MAETSFAQRVAKAWRAGATKQAPPYAAANSSLAPWWFLPSGYVDTRGIGDGGGNSAVVACLNVLGGSFAEAPIAQYGLDAETGQEQVQALAPAAQLVAQPNSAMVGELLWGWTLAATHISGDAYWLKARSAGGRVVELWPLMPDLVEPRDGTGSQATAEERLLHSQGRGALTAYYEYTSEGRQYRFETSDIVHLRLAIDSDNPRKGKAPLKPVLREVLADEEAGQYAATMLRNMGVPGVVLTPADPDDPGPDDEEADAIADEWENRFGGTNRGRPLVMQGGGMKVNIVSFSPQQMDYSTLRRVPEERVSAVLGVPAILAGLGAGLERATYSNASALREFFTEQKLAPLWRLFGAQLTMQLLPDFTDDPAQRLGFDTTEVRALQQDEGELWNRWQAAASAGLVTVAEFKTAVGLDPYPEDDVYLRPTSLVEVPAGIPIPDAVGEAERLLAGT